MLQASSSSPSSEDPATPSSSEWEEADQQRKAQSDKHPPPRLGNGRDTRIRQPKTTKLLADSDLEHLQICQAVVRTCENIRRQRGKGRRGSWDSDPEQAEKIPVAIAPELLSAQTEFQFRHKMSLGSPGSISGADTVGRRSMDPAYNLYARDYSPFDL